jgi:uncharacterized protein YjbI with pentapeptide repeats
MANPEHLTILKTGVNVWNRWRMENPMALPDLSQADLGRAQLSGADLHWAVINRADLGAASLVGANLSEADLFGAELNAADLTNANLYAAWLFRADLGQANLSGAHLMRASLSEADISGANLSGAALSGANLTWADLEGANFSGATTDATTFANTDLSNVRGLDTVRHLGPSSIGIDTIYRSNGKIPRVFLRGAGVPENFIEYMASLVGTGIEFYSLFISYSTHDQDFAERLHADLQDKGVRCWFAPHKLQGGRKVFRQIDEAVRSYDKLLLILSEASMASEWVRTEIDIARKREVEQKREMLFPIGLCPFETIRKWEYFDSDIGKDSAREIREFHIPDFSNWKDLDSYRKAFDKLLRDLQGEPDPAAV